MANQSAQNAAPLPVLDRDDGIQASPSTILGYCQERTEQYLRDQLDHLFQGASDELFAQARDAKSDGRQQDCFDAMQGLHRFRAPIEEAFVGNVMANFERLWNAELAFTAPAESTKVADELSLVDTQSIDDVVRIMGIISQAASRLRSSEFGLSAHFAAALAIAVNDESNPVSARSIGFAFQESLQNLGADAVSRKALYAALNKTVMANLGDLQASLNDEFIANGVLRKVPRVVPKSSPKSRAAAAEEALGPVESGSNAVQEGETRAKPAGPSRPPTTRGSPGTAMRVDRAANRPVGLSFQGAANAAHTLNALHRAIGRRDANLEVPAPAVAKTSVREIVEHALQDLQASRAAEQWGETGVFAFAKRISSALESYSIKLNDFAISDGIDLVSQLLDSLLADEAVETWAKSRIRRLAVPVLRASLSDGSFFASESHPARAVLNRLSILGLDVTPRSAQVRRLATHADEVIEQLLAQRVAGSEVFASSAEQLGEVVQAQGKLAAQTCDALVSDQTDESAVKPASDANPLPIAVVDGRASSSEAQAVAAALEPGELVLLRAQRTPGQATSIATLAWRDELRTRYLFSDRAGVRAWFCDARELALAIEDKHLTVMPTARIDALDRAMCGVLNSMHHRLERKAMTDPKTGLANDKQLEQNLHRVTQHAPGVNRFHHVVYLALESLAEIEFQCGRPAVEALMKQYASVLQRQIGNQGLPAHIANGHFAVLLPATTRGDVTHLLERHLRSIEVAKCTYKGESLPLRVAIGAIALAPGAKDLDSVLSAAREAYEIARGSAAEPVAFPAEPCGLQEGSYPGVSAGNSIREHIAAERLALRCQRIEPLAGAGLPYYEVLLGVRDEHGKLTPPGDVVALAEANGEILRLDQWVLRTTLTAMQNNADKLTLLGGFSVNLSGRSIVDPQMLPFVEAALEEFDVPTDKLIFEITESAAIGDISLAQKFVQRLQERGCRFALDDFGSGHASFSYLKLLSVDTVKIDGLFIRELLTNPTDEAMVRSISEIAKLLGMCTVAEYAENDAIVARLRDIGIDYAQGYGVERPRPLDELW